MEFEAPFKHNIDNNANNTDIIGGIPWDAIILIDNIIVIIPIFVIGRVNCQ
ncbi:MAG: hypothetical protein PHY59_04120 [Methanobacterium sp.]|nr:hypothetical protein [Methanobacterium sp.]